MEIVFELSEIEKGALQFLNATKEYKIIAFSGELGAGKTTFINALCKHLYVEDNVTSPTYSIIQEYNSVDGKVIYHMDLYRIKNTAEAINAGVEDCLNSGNTCLVEWPENAVEVFSLPTVYVQIEIIDNITRKLIIKFTDKGLFL